MTVTNYITINGKIHGEVTGGVATGYATDALGSVTATVDSSGSVANTYRYKPYGMTLSKTGSSTDPKHKWDGSHGYRITGRTQSESYVRVRHYGHKDGQWTTVDPLWPGQSQYTYCRLSPVGQTDPLGLDPAVSVHSSSCGCCSCMPTGISIDLIKKYFDQTYNFPNKYGMSPLKGFSGAELNVNLQWAPLLRNNKVVQHDMEPCQLDWQEWRSTNYNIGYRPVLEGTLQGRIWRTECAVTLCKQGGCTILDAPGISPTQQWLQQGADPYVICFHISLLGCNGSKVETYAKLIVKYDSLRYGSPRQVIVDLKPSDSSCDPIKTY